MLHNNNFTTLPGLNELNICIGDIRNPEIVKKCLDGVDLVIHLAAFTEIWYDQCDKNQQLSKEINVDGTLQMVNSMQPHQKLIFASSNTVYGEQPKRSMVNEDCECHAQDYYSNSKLLVEKHLLSRGYVVLRLPSVVGVSSKLHTRSMLSTFIMETLSKKTTVKSLCMEGYIARID